MFRVAYVNGRYRPHGEAMVHSEDRGYQFSDGVYAVCEVRGGLLVDERRHMARLQRSLAELPPLSSRLTELERFFYGSSHDAELVAAGRIMVPPG